MGGFLAGIPPEVITGGGFAGLALAAVWLIFTGRLVPKSLHEETRLDRDGWRKAYEELKPVLDVQSATQRLQGEQLDKLLEIGQTTEKFMVAIQQNLPQRRPPAGGR